jgi:mannose-6-phosphate isomerase-like protein (cupin superfamily)
MAYQHRLTGWQGPFWVACSHLLPGAGFDVHDGGTFTAYVVLEGEVIASGEAADETLRPMDSVALEPGDRCSIRNDTNRVATLLVIGSDARR